MSHALARALKEVEEAEKRKRERLFEDYPVGSRVQWVKGDRFRRGTVSRHGFGGRIQAVTDGNHVSVWLNSIEVVAGFLVMQRSQREVGAFLRPNSQQNSD